MLREHCATEGRDYDEIEKTAQTRFDLGENGENVQRTIESLHEVAELGFTVAHGSLLGVSKNRPARPVRRADHPRAGKVLARPRPPRTFQPAPPATNVVDATASTLLRGRCHIDHVSARCERA